MFVRHYNPQIYIYIFYISVLKPLLPHTLITRMYCIKTKYDCRVAKHGGAHTAVVQSLSLCCPVERIHLDKFNDNMISQ